MPINKKRPSTHLQNQANTKVPTHIQALKIDKLPQKYPSTRLNKDNITTHPCVNTEKSERIKSKILNLAFSSQNCTR